MSYYFCKTTVTSLEETLTKVTDELKKEGLGILTKVEVAAINSVQSKQLVENPPLKIITGRIKAKLHNV